MKIDCQGLVARLTQDTIVLTSAVKLGKYWRELAEKLARLTKQQIEAYEVPHQGKNGTVALEVRLWCDCVYTLDLCVNTARHRPSPLLLSSCSSASLFKFQALQREEFSPTFTCNFLGISLRAIVKSSCTNFICCGGPGLYLELQLFSPTQGPFSVPSFCLFYLLLFCLCCHFRHAEEDYPVLAGAISNHSHHSLGQGMQALFYLVQSVLIQAWCHEILEENAMETAQDSGPLSTLLSIGLSCALGTSVPVGSQVVSCISPF